MTRSARVVTWNGKDVPAELRELPAGRYVVEAVDDEAPVLQTRRPASTRPSSRTTQSAPRQIIDAALGR
jgi:hypothetical protein